MSLASPNDNIVDTSEWDARADVLYHFYAYHYFDQETRHAYSLDLINLDDADAQYYNRVADLTRGLRAEHKLAEYLSTPKLFKLPLSASLSKDFNDNETSNANAAKVNFRHELIHHVHVYNNTQSRRRRFFLLGFTEDDVKFMDGLIDKEVYGADTLKSGSTSQENRGLGIASDACLGLPPAPEGWNSQDDVILAVEKFQLEHAAHKLQFATRSDAKLEAGMAGFRTTYAIDKTNR